ncbi:MAG TPA: coenzyme F420 biosynthesis-associated protein [Actinobacteria bacterium]|jgi:coenzyme F420 biosynthesis associated uncharacterized protein|nr:coenzyme F420 biosynthesis-associated protein [Actinomycetota bacterium]
MTDGRSEAIDWDLALATARRFAPSGPDLSREEAHSAVAMLRDLAREAVEPVRAVTGLVAPESSPAVVVDRTAWIASNITGMRTVLGSWEALAERTESAPALVRGLGSRGTALQLGGVLAWLSTKVLGQFETFGSAPGEPGRLLLVAPSIVQVEQQLDVDPRDFRFWVCLHEETHRVQFGAVPWLGEHFTSRITALLEASDLSARETLERLVAFAYALIRSIRSDDVSVIDALQTPEQKGIFDELTGLMSLLEGHADVVMDDVGPAVVPSVEIIRERFSARREQVGAVDQIARRALGLDAKMRQYTDGASFVRRVVDRVGMPGFNTVWTSPQHLPSRSEIHDPDGWMARVGLIA